jgi:hypothetical protein
LEETMGMGGREGADEGGETFWLDEWGWEEEEEEEGGGGLDG